MKNDSIDAFLPGSQSWLYKFTVDRRQDLHIHKTGDFISKGLNDCKFHIYLGHCLGKPTGREHVAMLHKGNSGPLPGDHVCCWTVQQNQVT